MDQKFENYICSSPKSLLFQTSAEGLSQYLQEVTFSIFVMLRALSSTIFLHLLKWGHMGEMCNISRSCTPPTVT